MQKKVKTIVIVANCTWNIFQFRLNIIDRLIRDGYKVIVIAPIDEYIVYRENFPEVRHIGLRTFSRSGVNPVRDLMLILELIRKYKKLKPDLVLHYTAKPNIYGGSAAYVLGIPSIAVITGLGYAFINKGVINKVTRILYKWTSGFHQKMIFENADDLGLFIDLNIARPGISMAVKGCGVDLDYYRPVAFKAHPNVVFTFIGRILYDKGIREFVEAAKIIQSKMPGKAAFWVVGEMDKENPSKINREEFNQWIHDGIIEYLGFSLDIKSIIKKSHCVVLPSYREGMPRTILEAMAMGRPVITTQTAGCRETVDEELTGYLVEARNTIALVSALEKFLSLPAEAMIEMGRLARIKAENEFDDEIIAQQYSHLISNILNKGA
ncbi:MAG TPA: glycosyltransferase family 4 protein [Saprospiraceae bacterium]|nr:glycosyltransferase family 4 protein [Saprospiraceae bacterium]